MKPRVSKRIIKNNEKILIANNLEQINKLINLYLNEVKLKNLSPSEVCEFFEKWVLKRNKLNILFATLTIYYQTWES